MILGACRIAGGFDSYIVDSELTFSFLQAIYIVMHNYGVNTAKFGWTVLFTYIYFTSVIF